MIKKFDKYVDENKYNYPNDSDMSFDNFLLENGVTDDTVTADMMEWYAYHVCDKDGYFNPHSDYCYCPNINVYINEMLNKTSIQLLVKTLNKELGADSDHFVINHTNADEKVNILLISSKLYDRWRVFNICDKMMWSFTSVEVYRGVFRNPFDVDKPYECKDFGDPVIRIKVEPIKTKNITDFVKNECGGIIYHICRRDQVDNILRSGLRVKGEKNDYRYIKNKVYFFCGKDWDDLFYNLNKVAISKSAWDPTIIWIDEDEFALLKIDVGGYNIDFFMDTFYNDCKDYIGYTYNYIPPKRITEIDKDDFFKE